ncbi:MAG: gliding motility-associated C-terminal domain-containing protein [Sphingobacteriaceae bacterium]|nr:gliding motility-associated C-terminal domain-containing protein [Sphingobacteriaceae bacterium]
MKLLRIILVFVCIKAMAQLPAPSLRCIEVKSNGDVKLTWLPVNDPGGIFDSYQIFYSPTAVGTYSNVGTVAAVNFSTFTHSGSSATVQGCYYYIRTKSGPGGVNTSSSSDTLRSMFINAIQSTPDVKLNYNALHSPKLITSSSTYTLSREYPTAVWNNLGTTSALQYADTLSICSASINYQVQLADQAGCISASNIKGDIFKDKKAPDEPEIDSISVLPNGETVIAWKIPRDLDIKKYRVYYFNGAFAAIDSVNGRNNTLYTYTTTTANTKTVGLMIAAIDSCGNIGSFDTKPRTMYLETYYNTCAYSCVLNWNAYPGMKGGVSEYRIYYSVNGAAFVPIGTTTQLSFIHEGVSPGQNICYFIRAFNNGKTVSSSSNRSCFFSTQASAPQFIYIQNASVIETEKIKVDLYLDLSKPSTGIDLLRSEDGINYSNVAFLPFTGNQNFSFTDESVSPSSTSYFYKAVVKDSCGNPRINSNVAKTILLKIKSDKENVFLKQLVWTDYKGYAGDVSGYNIYRSINGNLNSTPIASTGPYDTLYLDNIEYEAPNGCDIKYHVEAVEGISNPFGFLSKSLSNIRDAYIEGEVFVPTAFNPSGVNKVWLPVTHFVDKNEYRVIVYDKWGGKRFETENDQEGWDGANAKQDVYVYVIRYKNCRGEYIEIKGSLSLL